MSPLIEGKKKRPSTRVKPAKQLKGITAEQISKDMAWIGGIVVKLVTNGYRPKAVAIPACWPNDDGSYEFIAFIEISMDGWSKDTMKEWLRLCEQEEWGFTIERGEGERDRGVTAKVFVGISRGR